MVKENEPSDYSRVVYECIECLSVINLTIKKCGLQGKPKQFLLPFSELLTALNIHQPLTQFLPFILSFPLEMRVIEVIACSRVRQAIETPTLYSVISHSFDFSLRFSDL